MWWVIYWKAGGLNPLTLDCSYDDAIRRVNEPSSLDCSYDDAIRRANEPTSYNPWEMAPASSPYKQPVVYVHFYAPNEVDAPHHMQMAAMAQLQQSLMLHQQMMMGQHPSMQ